LGRSDVLTVVVFRDVMLSLHFKGYTAFIWTAGGPRSADAYLYVYRLQMAWKWGKAVSACALLWHCCLQTIGSMHVGTFRPQSWRHNFLLKSEDSRSVHPATETVSHFKGLPLTLADHYEISGMQNHHISSPPQTSQCVW